MEIRMRHIVTKLFVGTAIAAMMAFGADNSLGTWKLNLEKSSITSGPAPVLTLKREAVEGGVRTTATVGRGNGDPITSSSIAKYDGKDYFVPNAPWDTISTEQVDANTFTATTKKTGGKYSSTSRTVISKDGKTMTTTSSGTNNEGKPFNNTAVFDKQ
jgi:hypothetical protein